MILDLQAHAKRKSCSISQTQSCSYGIKVNYLAKVTRKVYMSSKNVYIIYIIYIIYIAHNFKPPHTYAIFKLLYCHW